MITIKQLRLFKEVADKGSFSKAAEICCVTQPTLSNSIALLEETLEGKLFNRSTRHVSLTGLGRYLLSYAETTLTAHGEFIEAAKTFANPEHKLLRIGLSPLIDMQLLADILEPFKKQFPDLEIFFKECYMGDLTRRMEDETIDLAMMPKRENYSRFKTLPFYAEQLYFLPCEQHGETVEKNEQQPILLSEIKNETIIVTAGGCGLRDAIMNLYATEGFTMNEYRGRAVSYKVVEDWANLGIGAGILPQSKLSSDIKQSRPILQTNNSSAIIEYEISFPRNIKPAEHIIEFIQYLQDVAPQLLKGRVA